MKIFIGIIIGIIINTLFLAIIGFKSLIILGKNDKLYENTLLSVDKVEKHFGGRVIVYVHKYADCLRKEDVKQWPEPTKTTKQ